MSESPLMHPCRHRNVDGLAAAVVLVLALAPSSASSAGWSRTFGGPNAGEGIHSIAESPSGEIVVLASTDSFGTMTGDAWLVRVDADGRVLSQAVAGNALPGGVDGAVALPDGGAVFAHRNVRDIFIIHDASITRLAPDGAPLWTTDIASVPGRFFVNDVIAASDGSFVGVGQAAMSDAGPHVGWAVRLDADGNLMWQQYHGGVIDTAISFDAGIQTADGGFAVTGWMAAGITGEDLFVAKLSDRGALTWARTIGGAGGDRGASMVELPGVGYAIAGSTDSFTASGHSGWIVLLDPDGRLLRDVVLGADEWSDLQSITQDPAGDLVALGRISEPGFPTNDLWAVAIESGTGLVGWQRAYEGISGDHASEIMTLGGGDLLLAGTWGWGFPEEDLWLLRTDAAGRIDGCPLVRDTRVGTSSAGVGPRTEFLPPYPPFGSDAGGSVERGSSSLSAQTQCEAASCLPVSCLASVTPQPACEGTDVTLSLDILGGTPPFVVEWDVDGDTLPDTGGNPLVIGLPAGTTTVTAFLADACLVPETCSSSVDVQVAPATPPGEVSDVRGGAAPLRVVEHGDRIVFAERPDGRAYNIYAGAIGTWYAPGAPFGSSCFVPTAPAGPGLLEVAPALAPGSWLVVTASSACAEGPAGTDSFGAERMATGTWSACGPAP